MRGYDPPSFDHVPTPDAALFLCAIDHRTGYREAHSVEGGEPVDGSALLWDLACSAERRRPGALSAASLADVDPGAVAELFAIDGETVAGPAERALLWRDLAAWLGRAHGGSATVLLSSVFGRLGGPDGLIESLAAADAYSDPLRKKAFLFAKIAERRGWLGVADPESWEVCADNVLMRLALRSGMVEAGSVDFVRAQTRDAWKRVACEAEILPPVLDDLLWELGRDDPDLVGSDAGDLREPKRPAGTTYW